LHANCPLTKAPDSSDVNVVARG